MVTFTQSTTKMGSIPSVSLTPIDTCPTDVPCAACKNGCSAHRLLKLRKAARQAWANNTTIARQDPERFFQATKGFIIGQGCKFFRFHVGGDIPSQDYLDRMADLARELPGVRFLCFTKNHHLQFTNLPPNLTIVASMWPGWGNPHHPNIARLPKAWVRDATETRIPNDAIECGGGCDTCGMCWALPQLQRDVVFDRY